MNKYSRALTFSRFTQIALCMSLASATANAIAATSADLTITGTIAPSACTPSISNSGAIDFGNIKPDSLSRTAVTKLPVKVISYSINCDSAVTMATRWADGRAGTAAGDGSSDTQTFGLGTVGSAKIGGFRIRQQTSDVVADGGTPKLLYSSDSGSTWLFTNNYLAVPSKEMLTYTTQSSVVPAAFKTVSGKLQIEAYISKTEGFDFSNDIKLDGLATMEVIYL